MVLEMKFLDGNPGFRTPRRSRSPAQESVQVGEYADFCASVPKTVLDTGAGPDRPGQHWDGIGASAPK